MPLHGHCRSEPEPLSAAIVDMQSIKTVEESASISVYDSHTQIKTMAMGCVPHK